MFDYVDMLSEDRGALNANVAIKKWSAYALFFSTFNKILETTISTAIAVIFKIIGNRRLLDVVELERPKRFLEISLRSSFPLHFIPSSP